MDNQWFTLKSTMPKETTVHVPDHTVNHCIPQMNPQCSTAEGMMVLGTTLTFITMYSKLLLVQNGCTVVHFEQGSAPGDYCDGSGDYFDFCHNVQ